MRTDSRRSRSMISIAISIVMFAAAVPAVTGCGSSAGAKRRVARYALTGPAASHAKARHAEVGDTTLIAASPGAPFAAQMTLARVRPEVLGLFEGLEPIAGEGPIVLHTVSGATAVYDLLNDGARDGSIRLLSGSGLAADAPEEPITWTYTEQRGTIAGWAVVEGGLHDPVVRTAEAKVAFALDPRFRAGGEGLPRRWDIDVTMRVAGTPGGEPLQTTVPHAGSELPLHLTDPRQVEVRTFASIPVGASLILAIAAPGYGPAAERPILIAVITPNGRLGPATDPANLRPRQLTFDELMRGEGESQ